jgi:hypothetical protein
MISAIVIFAGDTIVVNPAGPAVRPSVASSRDPPDDHLTFGVNSSVNPFLIGQITVRRVDEIIDPARIVASRDPKGTVAAKAGWAVT